MNNLDEKIDQILGSLPIDYTQAKKGWAVKVRREIKKLIDQGKEEK